MPRECARCGSRNKPTRHHILPVRWNKNFSQHKDYGKKILFCRICHDELEAIINDLERFKAWRCFGETSGKGTPLTAIKYHKIVRKFIEGGEISRED